MKEREEKYEKRTQKDYSMPFKLSVVREIETTSIGLNAVARKYGIQSETTVKRWLEKYGTFDWENIKGKEMPKTKEQGIMELRQKLLLLEKKNSRQKKTLEDESVKATILDIMIDIAEKEYKIDIRKNSCPGQSDKAKK